MISTMITLSGAKATCTRTLYSYMRLEDGWAMEFVAAIASGVYLLLSVGCVTKGTGIPSSILAIRWSPLTRAAAGDWDRGCTSTVWSRHSCQRKYWPGLGCGPKTAEAIHLGEAGHCRSRQCLETGSYVLDQDIEPYAGSLRMVWRGGGRTRKD